MKLSDVKLKNPRLCDHQLDCSFSKPGLGIWAIFQCDLWDPPTIVCGKCAFGMRKSWPTKYRLNNVRKNHPLVWEVKIRGRWVPMVVAEIGWDKHWIGNLKNLSSFLKEIKQEELKKR